MPLRRRGGGPGPSVRHRLHIIHKIGNDALFTVVSSLFKIFYIFVKTKEEEIIEDCGKNSKKNSICETNINFSLEIL